ncbi:MAG: hypothetical protein ACLUIQ_05935 [Dialister invisus]
MPAIAAEEAERNRESGTETGASHMQPHLKEICLRPHGMLCQQKESPYRPRTKAQDIKPSVRRL